jgi:hypothetical protein
VAAGLLLECRSLFNDDLRHTFTEEALFEARLNDKMIPHRLRQTNW